MTRLTRYQVPQQEWICMLHGAIIQMPTGNSFCAFCNAPNPPAAHLEEHNYAPCLATQESERSFTRKDKVLFCTSASDAWLAANNPSAAAPAPHAGPQARLSLRSYAELGKADST